MLTRRFFVHSSLAAATLLTGADLSEAAGQSWINELVQRYLKSYDVPGLSLAFGRGNRTIFAQGYGLADRRDHLSVTPQSLFRIASVSKPFTSAAIFTLVDEGKLRLGDYVFGESGILRNYTLGAQAEWLRAITVEHLLTHTAGGWSNHDHDPMFRQTDRSRQLFLQQTLDAYPLQRPPGTSYAYSNFGYFLLGRVIEHVSSMPYGEYVRQFVQLPLGITDMQLARRKPAANEVHYYGAAHADPYDVPVELHDANGGWIATASDLVRFALGVFSAQDRAGAPALLQLEALHQVTQATLANPRYACGWSVSPEGNYFHSGGFEGTASFLMHRHDGLTWAVIVNTRDAHSDMERDLHTLSWSVARILQPESS